MLRNSIPQLMLYSDLLQVENFQLNKMHERGCRPPAHRKSRNIMGAVV